MKITKKQVMKALLTEPLSQGHFFHTKDSYTHRDDGKCHVCAVGAVLRSTGKKYTSKDASDAAQNFVVPSYTDLAYSILKYDPSAFLSVLSCEFESYDEEFGNAEDESRFHALMVAEGLCPDEFTIINPSMMPL